MSFDRVLLAVLVLASACADLERGPAPPIPDAGPDGGDGGALGFASVRPLLEQSCKRCHAPGEMAGGTSLLFTGDAAAEYGAVRALVDLTSPARSRLLAKAAGQGHGGGAIFRPESPEYAALLAWIQKGAAP